MQLNEDNFSLEQSLYPFPFVAWKLLQKISFRNSFYQIQSYLDPIYYKQIQHTGWFEPPPVILNVPQQFQL